MNLAISDAAETLLIPVEEHNEVKKSVAKMFEQRRPSRTALTASESPSSTAHQGYASSDDGRVVVEVQPEDTNRRRTTEVDQENEMRLCTIRNLCMFSLLNSKFHVNNLGKVHTFNVQSSLVNVPTLVN